MLNAEYSHASVKVPLYLPPLACEAVVNGTDVTVHHCRARSERFIQYGFPLPLVQHSRLDPATILHGELNHPAASLHLQKGEGVSLQMVPAEVLNTEERQAASLLCSNSQATVTPGIINSCFTPQSCGAVCFSVMPTDTRPLALPSSMDADKDEILWGEIILSLHGVAKIQIVLFKRPV